MSAIRSMSLLPNQLRRPSDHSASSTAQEVLQKIDLNKPLYQGRVFKQKKEQKLNGFNGFNKRYFVLYPGVLLYYEHERDYHEDLKLGMRKFKMLKLNGLFLTKVSNPPSHVRFCINLHLPDSYNERSEILLAFNKRKEKNLWMAYLQAQNPHLLPSD